MKYAVALVLTIVLSPAVVSQEITTEDLVGKKVSAAVVMGSHSRKGGHDVYGQTLMKWELGFGPGGTIMGEQSRVFSVSGQVKGKDTRKIKAAIAKPRDYQEGHTVWILDGSTLTRLSTVQTGAFKLTITFARTEEKWTCQVENTMAKEVGKGPTRQKGVSTETQGDNVDILNLKQLSSSCAVTAKK